MGGLNNISMHTVLQALDQNLQTHSCCTALEGQTKVAFCCRGLCHQNQLSSAFAVCCISLYFSKVDASRDISENVHGRCDEGWYQLNWNDVRREENIF